MESLSNSPEEVKNLSRELKGTVWLVPGEARWHLQGLRDGT